MLSFSCFNQKNCTCPESSLNRYYYFLLLQGFSAHKNEDWSAASDRDLNPDDIGKPGSATFTCDVSFKLFFILLCYHHYFTFTV